MLESTRALENLPGHVPAYNPLSPRAAFARLPRLTRAIVEYDPADSWLQDTATLPTSLQRLRGRLRAFAEEHLTPVALAVDSRPHATLGQADPDACAVLRAAGRAGLLSDMLPAPFDPKALRAEASSILEAGAPGEPTMAAVGQLQEAQGPWHTDRASPDQRMWKAQGRPGLEEQCGRHRHLRSGGQLGPRAA